MKRVLVANRGEIAVRVIRACRALGLQAVAVYSEADRDSLPVRLADRAVCIGPARAGESYLNINAVLAAATGTGCDAVHPGYGFLAENAGFAEACARHGLTFVGPPAPVIHLMGDKVRARETVTKLGVPVIRGSEARLHSAAEAGGVADAIGYPLLLKAAGGGGGRGMRIVRSAGELVAAFDRARAEALAAFGDGGLYVERFIENARHVEVQVIADGRGTCVHLGERDCSVQRRYQKLLEEAPACTLSPALRAELTEAATAIARHVEYESVGTVEFVLDQDTARLYFLEMNTRIQVEHPVSEMVTGRDLVVEQLRIAAGEPVSFSQAEVRVTGHAIECRINAEDVDAGFRPSPGRIAAWRPPQGEGIRVDTHCYAGYVVPPFYDSLVAKLVVTGPDRPAALRTMKRALEEFVVSGIATTIPFHRRVLEDPRFAGGEINTRWVEDVFTRAR